MGCCARLTQLPLCSSYLPCATVVVLERRAEPAGVFEDEDAAPSPVDRLLACPKSTPRSASLPLPSMLAPPTAALVTSSSEKNNIYITFFLKRFVYKKERDLKK